MTGQSILVAKVAIATVAALIATAAAAQAPYFKDEMIWSGYGWRVFKLTPGGTCFCTYSDKRDVLMDKDFLVVNQTAKQHDEIFYQVDGGDLRGPANREFQSVLQAYTDYRRWGCRSCGRSLYIPHSDVRSASRLTVFVKPSSGPENMDTSRPEITYNIDIRGADVAHAVLAGPQCAP